MQESKAEKILHGNKNYKVAYKDKMVWIENIDEKSGEALVSVIGTGEQMRVPVKELEGKGFEIK